jgi:delta-1-pyrroline-5-carboxylate synthetase
MAQPKLIAREDLPNMKRILIKVGTSVITQDDGTLALGRMSHVVEQIMELLKSNKEVVLVTSGAVNFGAKKLGRQRTFSSDLRLSNPRACAATGQSGIMAMYETLFNQKNAVCSQLLLSAADFQTKEQRYNIRVTLDTLIALGVVPIINENDVTRLKTPTVDIDEKYSFWDNDSLACLIAREIRIDLVALLTDVPGLYRRPPADMVLLSKKEKKMEIIDTYVPGHIEVIIGEGSRVGRGGMQAKIDAALHALREESVQAVVIASGMIPDTILKMARGERVGTLFVSAPQQAKL